MKRIKSLEDFRMDEASVTPEKVRFKFAISGNIKKVAKIQKGLIDVHQLLIEMSDEIAALKLNYDDLDPKSAEIINNMKNNIDNMLASLKKEAKAGSSNGMISNSERLQRNLERLKQGFLSKKGI